MSAAGKKGMADFQKKQERMRQKKMAKQGVRRRQNTFGYGSYGPKQFKEEIDPHIKTMIDNGDSDEKIKKMHPKITNDELKKLREQVDLGEVLSRQA